MPDGSYPIRTAVDVENAIQDFNRSGKKPDVKAHIILRAKAIGAENTLPDDWKDTAGKAAASLRRPERRARGAGQGRRRADPRNAQTRTRGRGERWTAQGARRSLARARRSQEAHSGARGPAAARKGGAARNRQDAGRRRRRLGQRRRRRQAPRLTAGSRARACADEAQPRSSNNAPPEFLAFFRRSWVRLQPAPPRRAGHGRRHRRRRRLRRYRHVEGAAGHADAHPSRSSSSVRSRSRRFSLASRGVGERRRRPGASGRPFVLPRISTSRRSTAHRFRPGCAATVRVWRGRSTKRFGTARRSDSSACAANDLRQPHRRPSPAVPWRIYLRRLSRGRRAAESRRPDFSPTSRSKTTSRIRT